MIRRYSTMSRVTKIFFSPFITQIIIGRQGNRKPSILTPPQKETYVRLLSAHNIFWKLQPRAGEYKKPPQKHWGVQLWNGASNSSKKENIWKHFDWIFGTYGTEQYVHFSRLLKTKKMRTFCHRKTTVTNQNF